MYNISFQSALGLWGNLSPLTQGILSLWPATVNDACLGLAAISFENTTILSASRVPAGSNIPTPHSCQPSATSAVDICRVYGVVNTTADSAVKFEMWLPDTWHGRFLTIGNGGFGGCIEYFNINYGTSMHFATIGSDNGHHENTGLPFFNSPEVLHDFAHRATHTEAVIGKKIAEAYYNTKPSKSYYLGCSTGGRQGIQSALLHPDDFDGIMGGAPAANFNYLTGWSAILGTYIGAPHPESSPNFIPMPLWSVVTQEILNQCDGLDGLVDGIISEPDDCDFNPQVLLCPKGSTEGCLTQSQIDALTKIYSPLYGTDGHLLYPRYDPGAEGDTPLLPMVFGGDTFQLTSDWMKYVIHNDSSYSLDNFGISDIEHMGKVNPAGIATWSGDLSRFRDRGGKLLTYHGRRDAIIASGISKRLHDLVSSTLAPHPIDDFYRLFLIPGMNHCSGGPGAWGFGQGSVYLETNKINDTAHNALLALVDWVEGGIPPQNITGIDDNMKERTHCLYPQKSMWSGTEWICVSS